MHSINWRHLADNKLKSETLHEIASIRVTEYDEHARPKLIQIITSDGESLDARPHKECRQCIYVMNDLAKTIAVYNIPKAE